MKDKISYIEDLRETETAHYSRKRPFDINRAALLQHLEGDCLFGPELEFAVFVFFGSRL
jgi:hypothetical protein